MNTTATTPSGNNQQSQYSSPPGRERLDFHSLLRFEDHGPTTQAAHEHPAQSTQDRRPPPRDVRDRSLGHYPYSYDTVAAGYVGRVGTWHLYPWYSAVSASPIHRRTSWTERPTPARFGDGNEPPV